MEIKNYSGEGVFLNEIHFSENKSKFFSFIDGKFYLKKSLNFAIMVRVYEEDFSDEIKKLTNEKIDYVIYDLYSYNPSPEFFSSEKIKKEFFEILEDIQKNIKTSSYDDFRILIFEYSCEDFRKKNLQINFQAKYVI